MHVHVRVRVGVLTRLTLFWENPALLRPAFVCKVSCVLCPVLHLLNYFRYPPIQVPSSPASRSFCALFTLDFLFCLSSHILRQHGKETRQIACTTRQSSPGLPGARLLTSTTHRTVPTAAPDRRKEVEQEQAGEQELCLGRRQGQ